MGPTAAVRSRGLRIRRTTLVLLAALGLGAVAVGLAFLAARAAGRVASAGPASVEDAVVALVATVGALVATWLVLGTVVSVADVLARRPGRRAGVPQALHRLVTVGMGVALLGATLPAVTSATGAVASVTTPVTTPVATPAHGQAITLPDPAQPDPGAPDPAWTPPAPLAVPRTAAPADPLVVPTPRAGTAVEESFVVCRGDTLWDLAASRLPAHATDAEIAAEWPRWHAENAAVIGPDPDLLLPGQLLRAPADPA